MIESSAIVFMVLILGFIWGGLAFFLRKAFRKEKQV